MIKLPIFWDYITLNDNGEMTGIMEDAPVWAKKAYVEHMKEREKAMDKGIKW